MRTPIVLVFLIACTSQPPLMPVGTPPEPEPPTAKPSPTPTPTPTPAWTKPKPTPPKTNPSGYFPSTAVWYRDVSKAPVSSRSAAVIGWLDKAGGWGLGRMQIDFSMNVLTADASTPKRAFRKTNEFYTPDCDYVKVPVPADGALEGETGYQCNTGSDCHLIVIDRSTQTLYEMWRADIRNNVFKGGCLATWDLTKTYPRTGRGAGCTSADASGFPIAPLLFTADEVAAGKIEHAIRFILPNKRIRKRAYVYPATHATGAAKGGTNAPAYGAHLRLRADYPVDKLPTAGARVVAKAMQTYGILLADGGKVALTAQSDRNTKAKWAGLLGPRDLAAIKVTDFELIDNGPVIAWDGNCRRN